MALPLGNMPDQLKQTGGVFSGINSKLLEGVNPKWLEPGSKNETLSSGEPADRITLKVDENNISEFTRYVATVLPDVLNELTISGLSSSSQTENIKSFAESWDSRLPRFH